MKKIILSSMMIAFGIAAQAQNVTLNVKLNPIQTLVVNPAQETVDLEYSSKEDYANGVTSGALTDHLSVFSTGGFAVTVKSAGTHLTNTVTSGAGTHGDIEAGTIQIVASNGTDAINSATNNTISLSGSEQTLVSSIYGAVDKTINVEYKGADANQYINYYVAGQEPTVYTTELTYTIVAQ